MNIDEFNAKNIWITMKGCQTLKINMHSRVSAVRESIWINNPPTHVYIYYIYVDIFFFFLCLGIYFPLRTWHKILAMDEEVPLFLNNKMFASKCLLE